MGSLCADVVVTYNRKELLAENIAALLAQSYHDHDILIIDNASTDGTKEMLIENYSYNKTLNVIRMKKNIGGAGGFFTGIKQAMKDTCDYLWIMDDDTVPTKDCLKELIDAKRFIENKHEDPAYFASAVYGENGEYMFRIS